MNVLLINGSPHQRGCTYTALSEVAAALEKEGIGVSVFWLGVKPVHGCTACNKCRELGKCVFEDDICNELIGRMQKADGIAVGCRRGGASASFDRLNKYFMMSRMPVITSQYWNSVHGNTPEETRQDLEGLQTMRTLGKNMAWALKSIQKAALDLPEPEPWIATNFIRPSLRH